MDNRNAKKIQVQQQQHDQLFFITEHDLLSIGLSKYYVENIMNRIREYKEIGYKKMWERVGEINGN